MCEALGNHITTKSATVLTINKTCLFAFLTAFNKVVRFNMEDKNLPKIKMDNMTWAKTGTNKIDHYVYGQKSWRCVVKATLI